MKTITISGISDYSVNDTVDSFATNSDLLPNTGNFLTTNRGLSFPNEWNPMHYLGGLCYVWSMDNDSFRCVSLHPVCDGELNSETVGGGLRGNILPIVKLNKSIQFTPVKDAEGNILSYNI